MVGTQFTREHTRFTVAGTMSQVAGDFIDEGLDVDEALGLGLVANLVPDSRGTFDDVARGEHLVAVGAPSSSVASAAEAACALRTGDSCDHFESECQSCADGSQPHGTTDCETLGWLTQQETL